MKPFLYILFVLFSNALFAGNNDTSKEIFEKLHHEGLFLEAMQEGRGMIYLNETPNDLEYAVFLDKLAECEYELEEYASAMNHLRKSLNIKKKVCGKKSVEYATTLHHIANCYSYMNDGKAENKEQNAFNIIQKTTEKWSEKYIEFLLYTLDYSNSDEVYGIADVLLKKTDVNSASMGHVFELIANYFFDNSNYLMAIEYYKKSIEHRSKDYGIYHPVYAERLSSLANCYWRLGMLSKSLELYNQAYLIAKKAYGEYHITSLNVLSTIARTEAEMGNFHDAEFIINKVLFLSSQKYGKNSIEYATFLALYGYIKLEQLDTDKAYSYIKESNKLIGKKEGKNSYNYVMNILNMSVSQYDNGNYKEAMKLINRYIRKANKVFGKDHELYQRGLLEKYRLTDDLDKSVKMLKNDLRTLGKDSPVNILGHTYEILAEKFFKIDFDSCVYYQNKALEVYESLYGKSHSRYISSKGVLGDYYFRFKKYKQSSDIFQEYLALKKEEIINRVVFMDYNERNNFFGRFNYVLNEEIPLIAYYNKTDNGLSKALYDAVLMKKGFLLNAEITLKDLLVEQRDSSIIQLYENLELLSKLKELTIESQASINVETDSLFERMQELETLLINKSSIYSLAKKRLLIESDDIQNIINKNDVSIEFEIIPVNSDSIYYCALLLKKGLESPKLTPLFELSQLNSVSTQSYYTTDSLTKLIWLPLAEELKDINNIYFSPIGELNRINIECLPFYDGEGLMSDHFNIYRLSSTRELVLPHDKSKSNLAVVYGGLLYDMSIGDMKNDTKKYKINRGETRTPIIDSLFQRKEDIMRALEYLPGSKMEAESVINAINSTTQKKMIVAELTGAKGTESSFKNLSGSSPNLVHIATHGFYYTEKDERLLHKKNFSLIDELRNYRSEEDKALTRSGLFFAGANHVRMNEIIPENTDDGVLTAQEIARINLRGLDLVVLSSCQSALGDISGDGVYGLQRGFKKAGTNSILMSLWDIDDNATKMLMEQFYLHFLSGHTRQESLKAAQRYVRDYRDEDGIREYESPFYWASFILLDGLE